MFYNKKIPQMVFLIGMPKCRTTSITQYLHEKYDFPLVLDNIEPHVFASSQKLAKFLSTTDFKNKTFLDGSLSYLFSATAIRNILRHVEDPIFIFALRDYKERYLSHWNFFYGKTHTYFTDVKDQPQVALALGNKRENQIEDEVKIISKFLSKNNIDVTNVSKHFLQHIIYHPKDFDYEIFLQIEHQLKKGPLSFFNYELRYYLKEKQFIPYSSILAFSYYGHCIRHLYKFINSKRNLIFRKSFAKPKIYVTWQKEEINLPNFEPVKKPKMKHLNATKLSDKLENKKADIKLDLNQFFKEDYKILEDLLQRNIIRMI